MTGHRQSWPEARTSTSSVAVREPIPFCSTTSSAPSLISRRARTTSNWTTAHFHQAGGRRHGSRCLRFRQRYDHGAIFGTTIVPKPRHRHPLLQSRQCGRKTSRGGDRHGHALHSTDIAVAYPHLTTFQAIRAGQFNTAWFTEVTSWKTQFNTNTHRLRKAHERHSTVHSEYPMKSPLPLITGTVDTSVLVGLLLDLFLCSKEMLADGVAVNDDIPKS